jgi:hypothetical protein
MIQRAVLKRIGGCTTAAMRTATGAQSRMISSSRLAAAPTPTSLHTFTEEEKMLREAGQHTISSIMDYWAK